MIAEGWLSIRPDDEVIQKPMADGGEGTLKTIAMQNPDSLPISCNLEHECFWLLMPDATAYLELASICGLTLQGTQNPMSAHTFELGKVLREIASDKRVNRIVLSVGGSASTDGGAGLLRALGARLYAANGEEIEGGGAGLTHLSQLDISGVIAPPPGGVTCLSDVTNPLLGPSGSAAIYSPVETGREEEGQRDFRPGPEGRQKGKPALRGVRLCALGNGRTGKGHRDAQQGPGHLQGRRTPHHQPQPAAERQGPQDEGLW